jgi:hypothetical protein
MGKSTVIWSESYKVWECNGRSYIRSRGGGSEGELEERRREAVVGI